MMQKYEHIYLEEIGSVYMVRIEIRCNNKEESKILFLNYVRIICGKKKIYEEGRKQNILEGTCVRARVCTKKSVKSLEPRTWVKNRHK